jgi:phosphate transport system substrate-binding protein
VPIRQESGACIAPSVQAARDASYQPLSRPLFIYINKKHADERPHVSDFIKFAFSPAESEKLVAEVGYVPLPAVGYSLALAKFDARKTGSFFDGGSKVGVTVEELLADAGK